MVDLDAFAGWRGDLTIRLKQMLGNGLSGGKVGGNANERTSCSWKISSDKSNASSRRAWIASRADVSSARDSEGIRFEAARAF